MGPFMESVTSDQPILELLVRSTKRSVSGTVMHCMWSFGLTLVMVPVVDTLEVENSSVVVVLAGKYDVFQVPWVGVGDRVT